jgi:ribosomal protein L3
VDPEKQLLMVHGSVPGINKGLVLVRAAVKKSAGKGLVKRMKGKV